MLAQSFGLASLVNLHLLRSQSPDELVLAIPRIRTWPGKSPGLVRLVWDQTGLVPVQISFWICCLDSDHVVSNAHNASL